MSAVVTRDHLEQAIWRLTGWRGGQDMVDELLAVADGYAATMVQFAVMTGTDPTRPAEAGSQPAGAGLVGEHSQVGRSEASELLSVTEQESVNDLDESGEPAEDEPVPTETACTKCGRVKPFEAFGVDNSRKGGRKAQCRKCVNEARRDWKARQARGER